ncbi:MAG: vitamin B12 dependent-methionine synthase activation domain-containing protein [Bacillota bacterium]|jgi:hypothetical protein
MTFLYHIDHDLGAPEVLRRMGLPEDHKYKAKVASLLEELLPQVRPKVFYCQKKVALNDGETVVIDGVDFHSKTLAKSLDGVTEVYPFLATAGRELIPYLQTSRMLDKMIIDTIMELILNRSLMAFTDKLVNGFPHEKHLVQVNPGSLVGWDIEEQQQLFKLYGGANEAMKVYLTEKSVMDPVKSVSGLMFAADGAFETCELCQRADCPTRRAEFDPALFEKMIST